MNGQSKKRQCFHNMVESFDVVLLMEDEQRDTLCEQCCSAHIR